MLKRTVECTDSLYSRRSRLSDLKIVCNEDLGNTFWSFRRKEVKVKLSLKPSLNVFRRLFEWRQNFGIFFSVTLFKKRFQHRCFLVDIVIFLRPPILNNICERLLLDKLMFNNLNHGEKSNKIVTPYLNTYYY